MAFGPKLYGGSDFYHRIFARILCSWDVQVWFCNFWHMACLNITHQEIKLTGKIISGRIARVGKADFLLSTYPCRALDHGFLPASATTLPEKKTYSSVLNQ